MRLRFADFISAAKIDSQRAMVAPLTQLANHIGTPPGALYRRKDFIDKDEAGTLLQPAPS